MRNNTFELNDFNKIILLVLGGLFIVTFIGNYNFRMSYYDHSIQYTFIRSLITVLIPVSTFPILMWVSKQFSILKHWKNVLLHLLLSIIYVLLCTIAVQFILLLIAGYYMFDESIEDIAYMLRRQFISTGSSSFLLYWGISIIVTVSRYYNDVSSLAEKTNALQSQLSSATLATLKAQLKPHFLFNTLNMVDFLIHTKPEKAVETVTKLEDLIKTTFDKTKPTSCTIKEEVIFLEKYLDIESARFSDRLSVIFNIDKSTQNIEIPCYLILPLVENSIKHGVGKTIDKCTISISSKFQGEFLVIEVKDDAKGFKKKPERANWSIGLKNIDERIKLFFGKKAFLDLSSFDLEGFKSTIHVPKKYL
ncbi:MAG: histidine kinase [Balneolaceae bacterium]